MAVSTQDPSQEWNDVVKIGRPDRQDATPTTLGQEWPGHAGMLADELERIADALVISSISPGRTCGPRPGELQWK
jgi:fumarate hydratase class II